MKKILWVNPSFLDYRIPLYEEIKRLSENNFHLTYSYGRVPERINEKIKDVLGENVHPVMDERRTKVGYEHIEFSNKGFSINRPKGLYKIIKNVGVDVVIAEGFYQFTPWALLWTFLHRKPLIIAYERTKHTERHAQWYRKLYRRIVSWFVTGYIANGTQTKEYLMSQGVKEENITTGGMCADSFWLGEKCDQMTDGERASVREEIGLGNPNGLTYIFVGRLIKLKGVDHLLKAWRVHLTTHPDDRLLIVGKGNQMDNLKAEFGDMPSVIFTGAYEYAKIYQLYAVSDVFVIPTLEDNWSLVVPEAMACKLPIACSIYNGCHSDLVKKDFNGTTFDPLQQESLVEALDYFHHIDRHLFGENSRNHEKNFNPERTAENVMRAVEKALKK